MASDPEQIEHMRRAFAEAIPEVAAGVVEIVGIGVDEAPVTRVLLAVRSQDMRVCPVGACVGARGSIIRGLCGRLGAKIDVVLWSDDTEKFLTAAFAPAQVKWVEIEKEAKRASVYVSSDQLSLALGKQLVRQRLVSHVSGYDVTVKEYW